MAENIVKEYICILHSKHECEHKHSYNRACDIQDNSGFAKVSCEYRLETKVIGEIDCQPPEFHEACKLAGVTVCPKCKKEI